MAQVGEAAFPAGFDARLARGAAQAIDDALRIIGGGKHASVGFTFNRNPALGEPFDGITGLPAVEGGAEFAGPTGIMGCQFGGIKTTVGHVAAPAPRDLNLLQAMFSLLEEHHGRFRVRLGGGHRGKESGGATTDDGDPARCWMSLGHPVTVLIANRKAILFAGRVDTPFCPWRCSRSRFCLTQTRKLL